MSILGKIKSRCNIEGGYKEFLILAVPLAVSTGVNAIQLLTDRIFLSRYSQEAFSASTPAGGAEWAIECFFFGILAYANVFVAQYHGKKEYRSLGPVMWQSVYLALVAAFIALCISFFAKPFFMNIGHPHNTVPQEITFFKVLCYGAFPSTLNAALAGFYSGRGKTKTMLMASICGVTLNIVLDYCLIFGNFGFHEMGIAGAAWATNISLSAVTIIYILLITSKKNSDIYNTRCMKIDFALIKRFLRYGVPNGTEFFFDIAGFTVVTLIVGSIGAEELAANNVVSTVNHTICMPIVGFGMATSAMVGNYLGKNKASIAQESVKSSMHITYTYVLLVALALFFFPDWLISLFSRGTQATLVEHARPIIVNLFIILAVYFVFDAANIIFASAIKGAGDTMFVMKRLLLFSLFLVIIPTYVGIMIFKRGVYTAWVCLLSSVISLAISFYFRYKSNKWKKMRVIEMNIVDE
ncbi:MATE family efflux transporter [Endomicrobiia bacterium]|nr:MATE family efflux transporter [Endomicrobiia bacterium]